MLIKQFLTGGRAIVIAEHGDKKYVFRFKTRPDKKDSNKRICSVLYTREYSESFIGIFNPEHGRVYPRKVNPLIDEDKKALEVANWIVGLIYKKQEPPEGYVIRHGGKCARCGRELTDAVSVEHGFGPDCWRLIG